ncbi:MAG: motility protein A [Candidatus Binatia bacterium]
MLRGFMAPALVLVVVALVSIVRPEFLDLPSLLLTLGGSVAVILFSYSPRQLQELIQVSRGLLAEKPMAPREYADELSRLTQLYRSEGLRGLERSERHLADPFLRRTVGMLVDLQKEEKIYATLERDSADASCRHELSWQILLTLTKTLPAFGLIGTLIGMVLLLRDLYSQDVQSLPAALSLAVLTTLYGAVLANVVVAPFAARLHAAATEKEIRMHLTIDWTMSLVRGEAASVATLNPRHPHTSAQTARSSGRERGWVFFSPSPQR